MANGAKHVNPGGVSHSMTTGENFFSTSSFPNFMLIIASVHLFLLSYDSNTTSWRRLAGVAAPADFLAQVEQGAEHNGPLQTSSGSKASGVGSGEEKSVRFIDRRIKSPSRRR